MLLSPVTSQEVLSLPLVSSETQGSSYSSDVRSCVEPGLLANSKAEDNQVNTAAYFARITLSNQQPARTILFNSGTNITQPGYSDKEPPASSLKDW